MLLKKAVSTLLLSAACVSLAQAQVTVGVITSAAGPLAMIGVPQKNTVALLPTQVGDQAIRYIALDDGSDPTATVKALKKLISEDNVDAIIGPSGSPNAIGVISFVAEAQVPLLSPVGTAAVILPMTAEKKWVFKTTQNDELIAKALFEHMAKHQVKTLGLIGTADPYGENWAKVATALASEHGIRIVANERFQRQDTSITGQSLKVLAARPDAVLVAAPGSPAVMPQATLFDQGYRGQVYQTHGAALPDFLKLGGKKVEGTILAASLMLVLDEMPDSNPSKKIAADYTAAYQKLYGSKPATFGANTFDAGLLLQAAIPLAAAKAAPGTVEFRRALRDALESTHELAGTQGVYSMTPADHSGFDERGRELIQVKNGTWTLLKD
ncbi:ABC transporter substrate-binding protein [Pseudomonas gessardii]|uniref:ABC transporter substrate-binding protein n=1 Tax=Pseudomonas gessardii TaxID=78544 RepID=A0ABS9FAQ3_9PSED|nr:ABC transporter substrate-binding protein [Pseudomonas gessardii]MBH3423544.1 ABC transporter substrate-binding protein [Pseudomonas gessardii]MCF4978259.1 ABC transporter substrate-binding protein [Pseudomonas gessardii]MCF4991233.1 ABC transporter substrate-binding protein [Pseudomonas gessardii]MCF5084069.1 ABC transporter substrate-binding protein [Pseudomonas gessardii]MCF5108500.1 ABC transporter substrate-binding protein [Pseudomonas gessardii]